VFFASAIATLFLAVFSNLYNGSIVTLSSASTLKFGDVTQLVSPSSDVLSCVVIGTAGGLMGVFMIWTNIRLARLRKMYIT